MRLSDLIDTPVTGTDGTELGFVIDVRCHQDGPIRGAMQTLRVHSLIVSRTHVGSLLGYERRQQQGPWLIKILVRFLHRHAFIVDWDDVEREGNAFRLRASAQPRPLPE